MMDFDRARRRYRPNTVRVAIIAESPPAPGSGRFFYFEDVVAGDSLFLEVMKVLYDDARGDTKAVRQQKREYLARFRDDGFYLIDASQKPIAGESRASKASLIRSGLGQLVCDLTEIQHGGLKVVLVSSLVYKICCDPLRQSGFDVVNTEMIDFPGFGRQRAFRAKFGDLIRQNGWCSSSTRGTWSTEPRRASLGERLGAMSESISKGGSYKELIARMAEASSLGFHLEASWIAYAMIEDRLVSALEKTGGVPTSKKGKPINGMEKKITELRNRLGTDPLLRGAMLNGKVLDDVYDWKEKRNPLMHALADEAESWSSLAPQAEGLAKEGEVTARNLADAVSRLRAQLRKVD